MKSIAEYFRDLAADDRYFGAEPPQPDAQMLHQIAEREVRRRVEARVENNGVVLRQTADAMPAGALSAQDAPPRSRPRPDVARGPGSGDDRRPSPPAPEANAPFDVDIDGDSVAAKLSRIRAVVARARATREADTAYAEDEPVEAYIAATPPAGFVDTPETTEEEDDFANEARPDDDSEPDLTAASIMEALADDTDENAEEAARAEARAKAEAEEAARAEAEARAMEEAEETARAEAEAKVKEEAARAEARAKAEAEEAARAEAEARAKEEAEEAARTEAKAKAEAEEAARADAEAEADAEAKARQLAEEAARAEADADATREAAETEARIKAEDEAHAEMLRKLKAEAVAEEVASLEAAAAPEGTAQASPAAPVSAMVPQRPHARVIKLKRTEFEAALAAGDIEEVEDDSEDDDGTIAEIDVEDDEQAAETTAEAEETLGTGEPALSDTLAAIIEAEPNDEVELLADRDTLADLSDEEDTIAAEAEDAGNLFEAEKAETGAEADESLTAGIRNLIGETSLDQEDENELLAELAEVERDTAKSDLDPETAKLRERFADLMDDDVEAEEDLLEDEDEDEDDPARQDEQALNRLLDETNAKLSDSEGTRRRSAIAHLKAAVAATRAEIRARGGRVDPSKDESLNRYRDDLAKVVRPRRPNGTPEGAAPSRPRPSEELANRPAPLVLVSELRVDKPAARDAAADAGPVRPRRVARSPRRDGGSAAGDESGPAGPGEKVSFKAFAEARGATELDAVLEAAALYTAEVEGQDTMSRPQLLRRAASLDPERKIGREQGLQSFGALLRSGRIRKLGKGRFALADTAKDVDDENAQSQRYAGE